MPAILLAMAPLWGAIRTGLSAAWTFATRPPGVYVAVVALVLLAIWGSGEIGYRRGEKQGLADCASAHAASNAAETARQQQAGSGATTASETRTGQSQAADARNQEIVNDVKSRAHDLPPVPAICPPAVPAALADRLRDLR